MAEGNYKRKSGRYWNEVRENALAELAERRAERDIKESELEVLNLEIVRLEQAVSSLAALAAEEDQIIHIGPRVEGVDKMTLADACRAILKHNPTYRTARGIRDSLRDSGYDLGQHSNPLAGIHGVLKRMVDSGEVEQLESEGKTRYRWKVRNVLAENKVRILEKLKTEGTPESRRIKAALEAEARDLARLDERKKK